MKIINQVKKTFGKDLDFVIFFVTSKCNSRCRHCFFWKSLNHPDELTIEEISKIFKNLGRVRDISLSGGEPILRKDIKEIIAEVCKNSAPRTLSIPSNGLLPDRLLNVAEFTLKNHPDMRLMVNLSIDGPKEIHENIRGVKGNFEKVIDSAKRLIELRDKFPNLYVNINSVIINKNISELPDFMKYIRENLDVDGHYFEVIRGDSKDKDFKIPEINKLIEFYKIALKNEEFYFNKRYSRKRVGLNLGEKTTKMFYIGIIKYLYSLQVKTLSGKQWPFRCLAGITSLVIYPQGNISVCELKPPVANLKNYGYDIKKLLESPEYRGVLSSIRKNKCSCTHDCFIYNTINHNPLARFVYLPLNTLK